MLFCIFFSSFCTYFFFQISLRCCFSCWRWRRRCIDPTICAIPKNCNKIAFIFERSGKRRETLFCKIFCFPKSTNISERDADCIFFPQALEVYLRNWILEGFSFLPKKIHSLQNYPLQILIWSPYSFAQGRENWYFKKITCGECDVYSVLQTDQIT